MSKCGIISISVLKASTRIAVHAGAVERGLAQVLVVTPPPPPSRLQEGGRGVTTRTCAKGGGVTAVRGSTVHVQRADRSTHCITRMYTCKTCVTTGSEINVQI